MFLLTLCASEMNDVKSYYGAFAVIAICIVGVVAGTVFLIVNQVKRAKNKPLQDSPSNIPKTNPTPSNDKTLTPLEEKQENFKKTRSKEQKKEIAHDIVELCNTLYNDPDYFSKKSSLEHTRSQYQTYINSGIFETKAITPTTANTVKRFRSHNGYVVIDVETTGLSAKNDKIIEIALLKIIPGHEVEKYVTFVNPMRLLSPKIVEHTGITDEDLKNAPVFSEIAADVLSFIENYPLVAHNARFDISFLSAEIGGDYAFLYADTLKMSRLCYPHFKDHKLQTLIKAFHLGGVQEHRAASDAAYTQQVFEICMKEITENREQAASQYEDENSETTVIGSETYR